MADAEGKTFVVDDQVGKVAGLPMPIVEELLSRGMFPAPILTTPRVWRVRDVEKWLVRVKAKPARPPIVDATDDGQCDQIGESP